MKKISGFIIIILFSTSLLAQPDDKDYAKMQQALQERIFGATDPLFIINTIPAEYKNESAVILAQKHTLESDSKKQFAFIFSRGTKFIFNEIFRKKILINDKAALDEFSEVSFTKLQSKTKTVLGKLKAYTFINIRIIKPNNSIKIINVDESAVTLKDEKNTKQNKIAIPGLSIGDIIDYYVCRYYEDADINDDLLFVFGDDYPILNFEVSLQFDKRISAEYQSVNGAPGFTITGDKDGGGNQMTLLAKNLPKIKGLIWSSAFRQLPLIRMNYKSGDIVRKGMPDIKQGEVEKATRAYADLVESDMAGIMNNICYSTLVNNKGFKSERAKAKSLWNDYIAKYPKANKPDSIAGFVFRYIKWTMYSQFAIQTNFNDKYFGYDWKTQMSRIAMFGYILLLEFKEELDFVVSSSKESFTWENLFSAGDLSFMARTQGQNPQYFSFEDNFGMANAVPYDLQGEKAKVFPFDTKGGRLQVKEKGTSTITLPSSGPNDNAETESIFVSTDPADRQLLNIRRKLSSTGCLKLDEQSHLTLLEETAIDVAGGIGLSVDLMTEYTNRGKDEKKMAGEFTIVLQKARVKNKEDYQNEIERNYTAKAKELKNFKLLNSGLSAESPFEFEEEFVMEAWSKKAGNNYLVDIGKCITSQLSIEKDQRTRAKDIYMSFPRSFHYTIEFTIPEGYTAEGIEKLSSKTENETGGFVSIASLKDNKLIIDIKKYYNHFYEPAANWPLMLSFIDKAIEFNQLKILLKKS